VVCVRVPPLPDADVRAFLAEPSVTAALGRLDESAVEAAGGAPGTLLDGSERQGSMREARRMLDVATSGTRADLMRLAFSRGAAGARGAFSDILDELTIALHDLARDGTTGPAQNARLALGASRAIASVEQAKARAEGNVSPQLVTAWLLRQMAAVLR
jgi:DNA polymerase III subunit delta'